MRLSLLDSDSGHANYLRLLERLGGKKSAIKVMLDGQPVCNCLTADEEIGAVLVFETGDDGYLALNGDKEPVSRWYIGSVTIEIEEG